MAKYGRGFEFRVPPTAEQAKGRFYVDGSSAIPQGAPVVLSGSSSSELTGAQGVVLETGATDRPLPGEGGIIVYEDPYHAFRGTDRDLTTNSDVNDTVPPGKLAKVVSGTSVKVAFTNTADRTFLHSREYEGRTMVAGLGATPTVSVGDYLTPGTGNDNDGYWAETADPDKAWLVVTAVDADNGVVEAQFLF